MAERLDHYRLLGRSGLRVSPLCLGTMTFGVGFGQWGSTDEEAEQMFRMYTERGGNFLDTANFYGQGGSERLVAKLVRGERDRYVIATKYSLMMGKDDPNACGNHRKNMMRSVEDSLKRLETDYIDLLYLHMWDFHTPVEEILRAFDDLVRQGKVNYVGVSDLPAWQASRMQAIADLRGWSPLVALQIQYNLAERTVERDLIPMAQEMGMGVLPWSPLAGGVLTGKYTAADLKPAVQPSFDSRKGINLATGRLTERTLAIADEVKNVAQELGCTPSQVALAWTLVNPAVTSTILGARTPAQLQDNLGALDISLSAEHLARLDRISKIELGFPHDLLAFAEVGPMFGGIKVRRRR
jgi:aryl-alcohol dehydrogenase-like predicted oxidoreductase